MLARISVRGLLLLLILVAGPGCQSLSTGTSPQREWRLPVSGSLRTLLPGRQREQAWNAWASDNVENGDIVFMRGDNRILLGLVNFSEFSAGLTDSRYSHVGIAAVEGDEVVVYDIRSAGTFRTRFGKLMSGGDVQAVALKRLRTGRTDCIPAAVEFCRKVYREQGKFDDQFDLANDRYYCAELVELAFRSAGQPLSESIPIEELPGFGTYPRTVRVLQLVSSIDPGQSVYVPGNVEIGLWSSPLLELVIEIPDPAIAPAELSVADHRPRLN